jgi:hypothetical protein
MTFVKRQLTLTIGLGQDDKGNPAQFDFTNANTVTLTGLRVRAAIEKCGYSMAVLQLRVYGLPLSMLNQLSGINQAVMWTRKNSIIVQAGDLGKTPATVFMGTIQSAYADMQEAPNTALNITAMSGYWGAVKPVAARSYPGPTDVGIIMQSLATEMGLGFKNSGVNAQLLRPAFRDSARVQVETCAKAANIDWDDSNGVLEIWPKGQARSGAIPTISPATGMVGYPVFTGQWVAAKSLFVPGLLFGQKVKIESSLKAASGEFVIYRLRYDLASEDPGVPWFV